MLIATINEKEYSVPEGWHDITLGRYADFAERVLPTTPEALKRMEQGENDALGDMDELEYNATMLPFFCRVVAALSNIPYKVLMQCSVSSVEQVYTGLCKVLAQPKENKPFAVVVGGERLYFPNDIMRGSKVQDFVEAAQLEKSMQGENVWRIIPKIACILMRKHEETYSDDLLKREPTMLSMSMSIAWQLYFFLRRQNEALNNFILIASEIPHLNKPERA